MMPSRGMGAIRPSKMPGAKKEARRDDTDFTKYAKGGKVKKMVEGGEAGETKKPLNLNLEPEDSTFPLSLQGEIAKDAAGGIGGGGRATFTKKLTKNSDIQAWLEGGGYKPEGKDYKGQVNNAGLRYNMRFQEGGKVNAAGNYTKPSLRKKILSQVKAAATQGTGAGQWSARKAQLVAKKYKAAGGGYRD